MDLKKVSKIETLSQKFLNSAISVLPLRITWVDKYQCFYHEE